MLTVAYYSLEVKNEFNQESTLVHHFLDPLPVLESQKPNNDQAGWLSVQFVPGQIPVCAVNVVASRERSPWEFRDSATHEG